MSAGAERSFRHRASIVSGDGFIMQSSDAISLTAVETTAIKSVLFIVFV